MGEVWESSSTKGGSRLVLLALADFANDEGYCHPSVTRLAVKSALTERNVQLILRDLEARGELVTLRGAGRGNVNAYWVLPPATVARLTLEGRNAKNFHPLRALEEKVKTSAETVKSEAQKAKFSVQRVKRVSPGTVINHQEPSRTTNGQTSSGPEGQQRVQTPASADQFSGAARAVLGTAHGRARSSAPPAASAAWQAWLRANPAPDWLEVEAWTRWLEDLDGRGVRATAGRLEEQLKRLRELSLGGEPQSAVVARAIAGGWATFYPTRATKPVLERSGASSDDRYGRYR